MSKDEADENQALSQTPPHIVHVHSGAFDTYSACLCRHQSSADSETHTHTVSGGRRINDPSCRCIMTSATLLFCFLSWAGAG